MTMTKVKADPYCPALLVGVREGGLAIPQKYH